MKYIIVFSALCLAASPSRSEPIALNTTRSVYLLQLDGVCGDCAAAIQTMLQSGGIASTIIAAKEVTTRVNKGVDVVIVPGGTDYDAAYADLHQYGADQFIADHVSAGGVYIGHCLGGDLAALLGIFAGTISDPAPVKDPQAARTLWKGGSLSRWIYFEDGPRFQPTMSVTVVATFADTDSNLGITAGDAAAIIYPWGKGVVGLLSPHPEASPQWLSEIDNFPDSVSYDIGLDFFRQVLQTIDDAKIRPFSSAKAFRNFGFQKGRIL